LADADLLRDAVRQAGALALSHFQTNVERWTKSDGSPVTAADLAVDAFLKKSLTAARPGYGWLSEETTDNADRLKHRSIWIADPIDGTRSFAKGSDLWCVAVALITDGRPTLSVIYRPVTDELYESRAGEGATLNGRPMRLAERSALTDARIIGNASALKTLGAVASIAPVPGGDVPLSLRLAFAAEAKVDAALSTNPKHDWDLAAGDLLVHEAGGRVTGIEGRMFTYNRRETQQSSYVAAPSGLHAEILKRLGA
jgi:myo-inositol-1(or 4)-monophosphatase